MKAILYFKEISDYVAKNYSRQIELKKVNSQTLEIKVAQKVMVATIKIGINITFEEVEDAKIVVSYSGSAGVELLVKGALLFIKEKHPELMPMITNNSGNQLTIDLEKIEKAKAFTEKVSLTGINIQDTALEISADLK